MILDCRYLHEMAGISENDIAKRLMDFGYHAPTLSFPVHGTLMVDVDKEKLGRYLSPPKAKLQAKGVASVRSRVVNLKELAPDLTIDAMKQYMIHAFSDVYGMTPTTLLLQKQTTLVRF